MSSIIYNNYNEIIENLYIGNINALNDINKFDFIVNCTNEVPLPSFADASTPAKECIRLPLNDSPDESDKLLSMVTANQSNVLVKIHEYLLNKKTVLVHCYAGMQRSCATVACYLIKYYKANPSQAIEYIKSKRPIAFLYRVNFIKTIEDFYRYTNNLPPFPSNKNNYLYGAMFNH